MANKEEAGLPFVKEDVYEVYWLDCDLLLDNPLLIVFLLKKVTIIKGRPCEIAIFVADKEGIF
jgi:hypothetical protein